jgi:hypothetical protein
MNFRPPIVVVVILLLLLPFAAAGTAESPEIVDVAGDATPAPANAYADLLDAWFVQVADGVEVHLRTAAVDVQPLTTAYFVLFDAGGTTRFAAMAFRDGVGPAVFARGEWDAERGFAGDTDSTDGTFEAPSHAVIRLPAKDLGPEGRATKVHALVVDYKPDLLGGPPVVLDSADEGRDFQLAAAAAPAGPEAPAEPRAAVPVPAVVLVVALAATAALRRRRAP